MLATGEELLSLIERVMRLVEPHWGFFAVAIVLSVVGTLAKRQVPKRKTAHSRFARLYWGTLPWHPVVAGMLLAFAPGMPRSELQTPAESVIYWVLCAFTSTWLYDAWRAFWGYLGRPWLLRLRERWLS